MSNKVTIRVGRSRRNKLFEEGRVWMACIMGLFILCFATIGIRIVELSFRNNDNKTLSVANKKQDNISLMAYMRDGATAESLKIDEKETRREIVLPRGDIIDRNGVLLATSLETASLYAHPHELREPIKTAKRLTKILSDVSYKTLKKRFTNGSKFAWIKYDLTPKEQHKINRLGIAGLYLRDEHARSYPHGNLLSHVLGYVNIDNKGLSGVEQYFDELLRNDNNKKPLQLSLDVRIQQILRRELVTTAKKFRAIGATGIVMHIPTGEVVALSNVPDFNPNEPPKKNKKHTLFNKATFGTYEMGSTFKTFTMAMGLENGVVGMTDGYDATNPIKLAGHTIRDSHAKKRWLSVPEIFSYSSNIGTVKMVIDVGKKKQQDFLKKLGLFNKVAIELPERGKPDLPKKWDVLTMATVAFGHGISVTPMHLMQGVATILNDGIKTSPTLIKQDKNLDYIADGERVMSEENSHKVRRLMRMVVQYGTGRKSAVDGYRVGGKTGTAEKLREDGKGYKKDLNFSSFIAAFPMDKPEYLVFVAVDEPKGIKQTHNQTGGGWVAAPAVGNIIKQMAPMLAIAPIYTQQDDVMDRYWNHRQEVVRRRRIHAANY